MFKRKLLALDYHNAATFKETDEAAFRNLIVWLEDQKIRHYKIEDRAALRNIVSGDWQVGFQKYLDDLGCPAYTERGPMLDWILGYAVRLEYGDNVDKYRHVPSGADKKSTESTSSNPLDTLDFESGDFKAGVASLGTLLQIPPHSDPLVTLKAICILIQEKLSKSAVDKAKNTEVVDSIALDKVELGFETGDYISAEAARILRLLHIRDLRELQTSINESIVKVQAITANPKTDTRLGKVGF